MLAGHRVLHRERLDNNFRLAPAGYLWTIEQLAEPPDDPLDRAEPDWFDRLLTPRERDIVRLVLDGHPTVSIAGKLGLSRGTVKNHRRRIYYKLDITTERELFLLYINSVTGR
jgi:DNA-binding CsgD family transcriptional regulator